MRAALQSIECRGAIRLAFLLLALLLPSGAVPTPACGASDDVVVITPADRVRIQLLYNPARVPEVLQHQFVCSIVGLSDEKVTVVLENGVVAIIHRDLVNLFEVGAYHGSRSKHTLVGAGAGLLTGVAFGQSAGGGGGLIDLGPAMTAVGVFFGTSIGALRGASRPAGEEWTSVALDRVVWIPGRRVEGQ